MTGIHAMDALLLGRKTYDIFAGYWPKQADDFAGGIAGKFNSIPKYVASRGKLDLSWAGTSQLGPDVPASVREIRDRHENIHVIGSLDFFQTLLAERLFDRLNLFVYPIVLGKGKKVFSSDAVPSKLKLAQPAISTSAGTLLLHYELTEGVPETGTMGE
jgi:dihydrofolate reductase